MRTLPFYRYMSAFLAFTMVLQSAAFAGNTRRVPTLSELEAFQKQARVAEERRQAVLTARTEEAASREQARIILSTHLFRDLPSGEEAREALLARQESLGNALQQGTEATRRMAFRLLGQSLAATLHHPARVAHLRSNDPLADTATDRDQGPFRTPGVRPVDTALDGEALDTRAEQTAAAAQLQNALASRPAPWTSGFLGALKEDAFKRLALALTFGGFLTLGSVMAGLGAIDTDNIETTTSIETWETAVTSEMGSTLIARANPGGTETSFGSHVGAYEAAWNTAIGNAPYWARPTLHDRVFGSSDFQRIRELEVEIHNLRTLASSSGEFSQANRESLGRLLAEAHQHHLDIAINLRQWLGWERDSYSSEHEGIDWSTGGEQALRAANNTASALNHWYVTLLAYGMGFGLLGFGLISGARLAALAVGNGRKRGEVQLQQKRLLEKLAEGYEEGCAQLGITPSAEITAALKAGSMDVSLALMPRPAAAAACESLLSPLEALSNLTVLPPPIAARVDVGDAEDSDDEGESEEADAASGGAPSRRARRAP